jgi:D-3-phosphoglycerate dehydrogenase
MTGRVLVTTHPFGEIDRDPVELLETAGIPYTLNPARRRLREEELAGMIAPYEAMIAGTEPITETVIQNASKLRLIARVGIGLDSVDLAAARARGIQVTYTPSAPSPAVAELAIGQMLALLRHTATSDREIRRRRLASTHWSQAGIVDRGHHRCRKNRQAGPAATAGMESASPRQ